MAGFLYYLPGERKLASVADAAAAGLGYAFAAGDEMAVCGCTGPDGGRGYVLADPRRVGREHIGYYSQRQTWKKHHAADYWIGWITEPPPGPTDLARREQLRGHPVILLDGKAWTAPTAICPADDNAIRSVRLLPSVPEFGPDGSLVPVSVVPAYQRLWEIAWAYLTAFFDLADDADAEAWKAQGITFDYTGKFRLAAECLAYNYALSLEEVVLLRLMSNDDASRVLQAAIDWPTRKAIIDAEDQKKTSADFGAG